MEPFYFEKHINDLVESKVNSVIHPLIARIQELEEQVASLEKGPETEKLLTREQLASMLNCSVRNLDNKPEFQAIKRKFGGRVYFPSEEVKIILDNLPTGGNSYENN